MYELSLLLVFPVAMALGGSMDLLTMTIPNRISLILLVTFVLAAACSGLPLQTLFMHVAAGVIMLGAGLAMFARGWVGGGDAKLLTVGALWIGLDQMPTFLIYTGIFGALLTLSMMLYRAYPAEALPLPEWAIRLHRVSTGLPYGMAIAAAALTVFPHSAMFRALSV